MRRTGLGSKTLPFFFSILIYSSLCTAELRDPTKPNFYRVESIDQPNQTDNLKLSSIWSSGSSKRVTINGIVAKQGDVILSDIRIIKIYNNAVKISQNGITKKLSILTHSYKTQ